MLCAGPSGSSNSWPPETTWTLTPGSVWWPLHAWMMNSFGFPARLGHRSGLNMSERSLICTALSVPNTIPSSPWLNITHTKLSQSEWSISANFWHTFFIWFPVRSGYEVTLKPENYHTLTISILANDSKPSSTKQHGNVQSKINLKDQRPIHALD